MNGYRRNYEQLMKEVSLHVDEQGMPPNSAVHLLAGNTYIYLCSQFGITPKKARTYVKVFLTDKSAVDRKFIGSKS